MESRWNLLSLESAGLGVGRLSRDHGADDNLLRFFPANLFLRDSGLVRTALSMKTGRGSSHARRC